MANKRGVKSVKKRTRNARAGKRRAEKNKSRPNESDASLFALPPEEHPDQGASTQASEVQPGPSGDLSSPDRDWDGHDVWRSSESGSSPGDASQGQTVAEQDQDEDGGLHHGNDDEDSALLDSDSSAHGSPVSSTSDSSVGVRTLSPECDEDKDGEEGVDTGEEEDGEEEEDSDGAVSDTCLEDLEGVKLNVERGSVCDGMPPGLRVVDPRALIQQAEQLGRHALECTAGRFVYESQRISGLGTAWTYLCTSCGSRRTLFSHGVEKGAHERKSAIANDCLAWGAMATGTGYAQTEELLSTLDVPMMSRRKFAKHEDRVGDTWSDHLTRMLEKNGELEWKLAKELGQVVKDAQGNDTDVMYTAVIGDAGWGKRSYGGHGMTSPAGVGVLIGQLSGKPLHVGVRNTYCSMCTFAKRKGISPKEHDCYMNFKGYPTAMEKEIIVDGFNSSIETHKLKYLFYIGDGDSSTFREIQKRCDYGPEVEKIDCANHVTVRFSDHLHGLTKKTVIPCQARKELEVEDPAKRETRITRLVKGTRTAIKNAAKQRDVGQLRRDLRNAPLHVFGQHTACGDFCSRKELGEKNLVPLVRESGLLDEIMRYVEKMILMVDSLVRDATTNEAERFMALVAKANGAKRVAHWKRGGYQRRCHAAAMSHSKGPGWIESPLREHLQGSPGARVKMLCANRERHRKRKLDVAAERRAKGEPPRKVRRGGRADLDYGPEANLTDEQRLAAHPDMPDEDLAAGIEEKRRWIWEKSDTKEKLCELERSTVGQHSSARYRAERKWFLPSSQFGAVMTRRATTQCDKLVKSLLYPAQIRNLPAAMQYGIDHEETAVQKYVTDYNVTVRVEKNGLFVNPKWPYLCSSPDRLLGEDGVIEAKCIYPLTLKGNPTFLAALKYNDECKKARKAKRARKEGPNDGEKEKKEVNICLEVGEDGALRLKRSHAFYYQVQGQLAITERQYCMFLVMTDSTLIGNYTGERVQDFFVERIEKDENLWCNSMVPKLKPFFMDCMLVEMVLRRQARGLPCRDPRHVTTRAGR